MEGGGCIYRLGFVGMPGCTNHSPAGAPALPRQQALLGQQAGVFQPQHNNKSMNHKPLSNGTKYPIKAAGKGIEMKRVTRKLKSAADGNGYPVSSGQRPKHIMTRENNVI